MAASEPRKRPPPIDLMLDLETLATSSDAVIVSIGALWFHPHGVPVEKCIIETFHAHIELDSYSDNFGILSLEVEILYPV